MKKKQLLIPSLLLSVGLNAQVVLSEDFGSANGTTPPAGWNNTDLGTSGILWAFDNPGQRTLSTPITDPAAIFDSGFYGTSTTPTEDAVLESPAFDASLLGSFVLEFDHNFQQNFLTNATYAIEAWNGTSWNLVFSGDQNTGLGSHHVVLDVTTAVGSSPNAKVRFHWIGTDDQYWIVDNVTITRYDCVIPTNLVAANITTNTVDFSWTGGTVTDWNVEYGPPGFTLGGGTFIPVSGTPFLTLGVTSNTHYDVYVQSDCGAGEVSLWAGPLKVVAACPPSAVSTYPWTENFNTIAEPDLPCGWLLENTNNDNYTWQSTIGFFGGTLSLIDDNSDQTTPKNDWLYTPELILTAGTTYQIAFQHQSSGAAFPEKLTVYLGNAQTVPAMTTQVLDLPNIVNQFPLTSSATFTVPATGSYYLGFHGHSDGNSNYLTLDNITVSEPQSTTCISPATLTASNISATSATVSWTPQSGIGYEYVVDQTAGNPISGTAVTGIAFTIAVSASTTYYLHVRTNCGNGNYSAWSTISFTTPAACPIPTGFTATNVTPTSATISWTASSGASDYQYVVNTVPGDPSGTGYPTTSTNSVNPTTLSPATTYYVHVLADCGGGNYSQWSVYQFTTPPSTCPVPTGFTATTVTSSSATISWTASSGATGYQYVVNTLPGDPSGSGYPTTSTNSFNPTGLLPATTYYAHVRTDCGSGNYSSWAQYQFITTASVGLDEAAIVFHIYPNPTKGLVHITSSAEGMVHVSVVDFAGKEVLALPATAQASFDLDLSGLESGVYFVKFLSEGIQETQRIVLTK